MTSRNDACMTLRTDRIVHIVDFSRINPGWLLFGMVGFLLLACSSSNEDRLIIAGASSTQFALDSLVEVFEATSNLDVETVFSSSGKLTAQIRGGAPYDLFLSADMKYPEQLFREGLSDRPVIYARGRLVVWSLQRTYQIDDLRLTQIQRVAIANPKTAPYGIAAQEALASVGLDITSKLVYGESIAQTNHFVTAGAADVGLTAKSIVLSPNLVNSGYWTEVPSEAYRPIHHGVVMINGAKASEQTLAFREFLFSSKGKAILDYFGFDLP